MSQVIENLLLSLLVSVIASAVWKWLGSNDISRDAGLVLFIVYFGLMARERSR